MADLFRFPFQETTGNYADTSGNDLALTANGITPADNTAEGPGGEYPNALALNGTDEWFDFADQILSGEFTVAWWSLGKRPDFVSTVLGRSGDATRIGYNNDVANLSIVTKPSPNPDVFTPAHGIDVNNIWHHILIRRNASGGIQIFVNGVLLLQEFTDTLNATTLNRIGRDTSTNYHQGRIAGVVGADHRYSDTEVESEYQRGIDSDVALQFYSPIPEGRYHAEPGDTFAVPIEIGYAPDTPSLELRIEDLSGGIVHGWAALSVSAGTAETAAGPRDAWIGVTPALERRRYVIKVRETTDPTTVISQNIGVGRGLTTALSQSNGVGVLSQAQPLTASTGEGDARHFGPDSTMAVGWELVDEVANGPIHTGVTNQYSIWPLVASKFLELEPDVPVFFIPVGAGGATINGDWGDTGSVMDIALNTIAASKVNSFDIMMWQGEAHTPQAAPSEDVLTASEYVSEVLRAFATVSDSVSGSPRLYVTQLQPLDDVQGQNYNQTYLNEIRAGQRLLWNQPSVYQGPIFVDILVADLSDEVHIKTNAEAALAADRVYRALTDNDLFVMQTLRAVQGLQTIEVTFNKTIQVGTLTASAWRVTAGSQTVSVQTAVSDGTKVTLSLDAPLVGSQNVEVALAEGFSGRGAVVPLDGNGDPSPAESLVVNVVSSTADETAVAFVNNPTIAGMIAQVEANALLIEELREELGKMQSGTTQPRINRPAAKGFRLKLSARHDGTHKCTSPVKLRPGPIGIDGRIAVAVDMSPVYGDVYVIQVGAPVVSEGTDITATALGPRDQEAMIELDGEAIASDEAEVTVPVTMDTGGVVGETIPVTFDVKVFDD